MLVFCRIGTAIMLLPGFGEVYVALRVRLLLAVLFSMVLAPALPALPPPPDVPVELVRLVLAEVLVGLFLGGLSRLLISAMHISGMIIAYQSSLASAVVPDITQTQGQGTSLSNLMGMLALVLLFATDLHHLMLSGLSDSYTLFLPGEFPLMNDVAEHVTQTMSGVFRIALQLASPHIVIGLFIYLGAGIISRLMPNMQIFFILMAPQILLSFAILMITISAIMLWYLDYFRDTLTGFLTP